MTRHLTAALTLAILLSGQAFAQETEVSFGGVKADPTQPVEVTSDTLNVDQTDGTAVFTGNVIVIQGEMRMTAAEVTVNYTEGDQREIETMKATGGVTLVSGPEAAESKEALYTVASGTVVMTGDVLLTQGKNVMNGQLLTVDLTTGKGRMEGRVKTVLQPAAKTPKSDKSAKADTQQGAADAASGTTGTKD